MADPREILAQRVADALEAAFGSAAAGADPLIRPSQFADFQANVALPLGKRFGKPPREVAAEIVRHLDVTGVAQPPEVSGPGFINFSLLSEWVAGETAVLLADPRLGVPEPAPAQKIVVDYSGPNVAKELHVGHLRATVIGDALVRIFEYLGHEVVRAAHLGDWGTPFGMLIEHVLDVGEAATHAQLAAGEFTEFYQAARLNFTSVPEFAERARARVAKLQGGDEESLRLWGILVAESMQYLIDLYTRLGITLTAGDMAPESFYNPMLADVCKELEAAGIAVISEGALCAFPAGFTGRDGKPLPLMLRKSDGGYGYDTTDVAAIRHRLVDLHVGRIVYVVGSEQMQHLQMVFQVAREAGWLAGEASAEHAVVGMVTGADGKRLKTREGEQVKLVSLIDEAVERAAKVIAGRYDDPALRAQIAEAVGIGAVKYGDLSVARDSSYAFDFDRMLALTGNTGPYLQYATVRIRSIFRRGGFRPEEASAQPRITHDAERALALTLLGFGSAVTQSAAGAEPHRLAGFLFDVASAFTTFFENCPVLQAPDPGTRDSRLALSALTLRVLTTGLGLLGVPVPERM